jgi:hypothetical protein
VPLAQLNRSACSRVVEWVAWMAGVHHPSLRTGHPAHHRITTAPPPCYQLQLPVEGGQ